MAFLPRSKNIFPLRPSSASFQPSKTSEDFFIESPKLPGEFPTEDWVSTEGQLSVDVYETDRDIVVQATIAGVRKEDLEISLHNETLTVRGRRRQRQDVPDQQYFYRECYWGDFSRTIILPVDVKNNDVNATLENGVLTILLPKSHRERNMKINIKEL
jgi:HSP20 family protein